MGLNKLGDDLLNKIKECKSVDDYKGILRDSGIALDDAQLEEIIGGLSNLPLAEAQNALLERLNVADWRRPDGASSKDNYIDKGSNFIQKNLDVYMK